MNTNNKLKIIILLIVLAIIYMDSFYLQEQNFIVEEYGEIKIFFCKENDCEHELIKIINNSETLKCAFYDITNEDLIKKLEKENAEIITHNNEKFEKINTKGLMHHKFCIINQTHITTGSYNPTQKNQHHENLIVIESKTLAKNYEEEFVQLKRINNQQQETKQKTKTSKIIYNDYELENYFCPQDNCQEKIIKTIEEANNTIYFLLFTFTDTEIAKALIQKKEEGLIVEGIIENFQNKQHWVTPILEKNNVTIKIHSSNIFQHNKIIIADDKVITGSYNPTRAANTINDENILIITQQEIVKQYKDYFRDLYEKI
jgi:phosphatidylserine/phosphatidylglycerophosphate/cardiolipin synthase-like enzyme